jgi:hypothetical protein
MEVDQDKTGIPDSILADWWAVNRAVSSPPNKRIQRTSKKINTRRESHTIFRRGDVRLYGAEKS